MHHPDIAGTATPSAAGDTSALRRAWSRWPRWTAWGALVWSASYAVAGLLWWSGVDWYPFAEGPLDRASASLLERAPASVVGPAFAAIGALGTAAAAVLLRETAAPFARRGALLLGAGLAVTATSLIPDYTMLALLAMWPVLLVFTFTGVEGAQDGIGDILYWHRVNLILIFIGGILWGSAVLAASRRMRGSCAHCGRGVGEPAATPEARTRELLRRGRSFVWLAVLATLPYDVTRIAWYLGWPLGLSEPMYESLQDPPELLVVGMGLGILSTMGAAMTHGLVADWGERFPGWVPRWGRRRVPVMLAVVPATMVAVTLPPASVMFAGTGINGGFDLTNWGLWLPSMFWLLWAVGLGGATWTYYLRRRGACRHCTGLHGHEARGRMRLPVVD